MLKMKLISGLCVFAFFVSLSVRGMENPLPGAVPSEEEVWHLDIKRAAAETAEALKADAILYVKQAHADASSDEDGRLIYREARARLPKDLHGIISGYLEEWRSRIVVRDIKSEINGMCHRPFIMHTAGKNDIQLVCKMDEEMAHVVGASKLISFGIFDWYIQQVRYNPAMECVSNNIAEIKLAQKANACVMMPCGIVIIDENGAVHVGKKNNIQGILNTENVRSIAKISDTCLAVGRSDARIELWHLDGNELVKIATLCGDEGESFVALAAFDCTKLVSCSENSQEPLKIWNLQNMKQGLVMQTGRQTAAWNHIVVSPDGKFLVSTDTRTGYCSAWDTKTGLCMLPRALCRSDYVQLFRPIIAEHGRADMITIDKYNNIIIVNNDHLEMFNLNTLCNGDVQFSRVSGRASFEDEIHSVMALPSGQLVIPFGNKGVAIATFRDYYLDRIEEQRQDASPRSGRCFAGFISSIRSFCERKKTE